MDSSQRELQAMETMTSAFIHKFPRVTPDLFVDLSQFIPFMSVSDIMSFPTSLMVNTSVLMAIRDHSTEMKSPQKQAFVKRLLQSSVVGDVPSWPPNFLSSILPLLPHLPVSQFQQLTSDQAVRPLNASTLPPPALATLRGLLPQLGASFLQSLPSLQLLDLLTQPGLPSFSPAQLTMDILCRLKPLLPGLSPAVLRGIHWSEISGTTHCQCWSTLLPALKPAHRAMLHKALQERKCVVEELRQRPEEDLDGISPWFAAELPVNLIESLSNTSLTAVLAHIQQHFVDFIKLPRHKQMALAEKTITVLGNSQGLAEGELRGASVDLLGPLLPFLDRDTLGLVDRGALGLRLDELRGYCLPWDTLKDMAALLTGRDLLGWLWQHWACGYVMYAFITEIWCVYVCVYCREASAWTVGDVELVGRLLFTLSPKQINSIPLVVLSADTVEEVLAGQWRWENSDVGQVCASQCVDQHGQRERIHSLIRGVVRAQSRRRKVPVPSCGDIRGTFPSAWTANQLSRMAGEELRQCTEVIGQDASLSPDRRRALWVKLRQAYSPVRGLRPEQVLGLGCLVTELGERELQDTNLTDLGVLAYLGALTDWSPKKMRAAVVGVMRKRKLKVEQLGAVEVASLGHLLCGFTLSEINRLDPYNLSMAALFLRELALPCSEQQMEALTARLSSPQAFGPVSTWGPEVFTEIGTLAAGLEDMVLSALVQEQVEGLIPDAIALIPPTKMAVVFSAVQLSWLNVEQAWVVTEKQWAELNSGQRHALGLVQYEGDVLLEHRGRNVAPATRSADSLTVCLLSLCCMLWQLS
ncbi:stereocilin [Oncorhynchus kisutch]|uniref:stereocilin n=1 Tax=Oncorhynchus kisutch TaxID=8019 RepID=UPI0012DC9A06|nr:stereocilin [Oncorhynchus kisutch]